MKSNRFWIILLCGILVICTGAIFMLNQPYAEWAFVYQDGVLINSVDLAKTAGSETFLIEHEYNRNLIVIEQGRIRISEANCPDGYCVRQGWVSGGSFPIVCLPHRVVITFGDGFSQDYDAITG